MFSRLKFSPHVGASDCLDVEVSLRCGESLPVMSPPPTWGRCTQPGPAARSPCRFNAANWVCTVLTWCAPSAAHTAPVSPGRREGGGRGGERPGQPSLPHSAVTNVSQPIPPSLSPSLSSSTLSRGAASKTSQQSEVLTPLLDQSAIALVPKLCRGLAGVGEVWPDVPEVIFRDLPPCQVRQQAPVKRKRERGGISRLRNCAHHP